MDNKTKLYAIGAIVVTAIAIAVAMYFKDAMPTSQTLEGNATVNNQKEMKTNAINGNNNTVKSVEGDLNAGGNVNF